MNDNIEIALDFATDPSRKDDTRAQLDRRIDLIAKHLRVAKRNSAPRTL